MESLELTFLSLTFKRHSQVLCLTAWRYPIITRHILNYCLTTWLFTHPEHKTGFEPVLIICYKQKFAVCVLKVIF